jgi:lipopolysaccharide transport system permease protein
MGKHIRALWGARDVLYTWTVREIKVRYTDTRLGLAWILLYPACWVIMFTLLFSLIFKTSGAGIPYPLFVMAGLVPWFFFSNTISNAVSSLRNNAHLIPKVYFPREILPLGSVLVGFLDLALYLVLMFAAMAYYRVGGGAKMLMAIPILGGLAALTLGMSLLASRLALFRREVQLLVPLALQFTMYTVPIFYRIEIVPVRFQSIYLLNPVAGFVDALRRVLVYGLWPRWPSFVSAMVFALVLLVFAYSDFKRAEPEFADRL